MILVAEYVHELCYSSNIFARRGIMNPSNEPSQFKLHSEYQPIPTEEPLLHAKNTLLTPHVAFLSEEAMVRRAEIEFSNVYAYLNGKPENVCTL